MKTLLETFIIKQYAGNCAGCGQKTFRFSKKYNWFICLSCNSQKVMESIADHVMYPNREDWE